VLAALMKQSSQEPSMEEKLLGPSSARGMSQTPDPTTTSPTNLADALAQRDKAQA
jgi:hypothetical protein